MEQNIRVSVDAVIFCRSAAGLQLLLVRRKNEPFKDAWCLPGGFVEKDEDLAPAALRELEEETGLRLDTVRQLAAFGTPGRDPRGHTVTIAHYAVLEGALPEVRGNDDAADARWFGTDALPELGFDHGAIIATALQRLDGIPA